MEGIGYERAVVQRQGRAQLPPDLSDHHGLAWRLEAIQRRETGERIVILGRVAPECHRPLGDSQLGRQTGAPMAPRPRGSSGLRCPSCDGGVSVEIVRASSGEEHQLIGHEPRIGPGGVSCLHPDLTHPG